MKRIPVVLFFLLSAAPSFAQLNVWRWQNPLPTGDYLQVVQMLSLDDIYICGENGTFLKSSDGGNTWTVQSNIFKFQTTFYSLSFPNKLYGMCAGDSGRII